MARWTWPDLITGLINGRDLDDEAGAWAMDQLLTGRTSPEQMSGFLVALRSKGETSGELSALSKGMLSKALPLELPREAVDIVGTGGDRANTVNVSTMASIVTAASGRPVIKHGNRAASSWSGTADCLEALGVNIDQPPAKVREELDTVGMAFLFAQRYHQSMKHVGAIRRELGIRTVFNILGPLTNPARPTAMLLGVYSAHLLRPLANVLPGLGVKRALIVHGTDGMDEISIGAPTLIHEIADGWERSYEIHPEDFGITPAAKEAIRGGKPDENAAVTRGILSGEITDARADVCLLNAGAAIYIGGAASSIADGIAAARQTIADGSALRKLEDFIRISQ